MSNLRKIVLKSIAKNVCRLTGSTKPYRKIMGLSRKTNKDFSESNCHGFTMYMLGLGEENSGYLKYVNYDIMDSFLTDNCFKSQKNNGLIIAFREGDKTLGHTGIFIPNTNNSIIIHQPGCGSPFEFTTLDNYLNKTPDLKLETTIEYYKYFPDNLNISNHY